jgi:hypothetical protein
MEIQGIVYTRAMLETPADLELGETYELEEVPPAVLEVIESTRLLELEGVFGDERVSDPVEYDRLTLQVDGREVAIEVYNRGVLLYTTGDPILRRIDRVIWAVLEAVTGPLQL